MQKLHNLLLLSAFLITILIFAGCASMEPMRTSSASIGPSTSLEKDLKNLPLPKEKIVAAVYSFRDQTGQYKISTTGSSFSTAVTQGATSILLKALEDSGWFIPIEREGLSDLLNERKIIRSSRENYLGADGKKLPDLPPLLYAGVIFEGGIISYDTNVLTGGEGIKYLGLSASGQYHQDRVTVYLRAVSTQNGRILKTVYASKTILSQEIDLGVYKFVSVDGLLQSEVGFTYNEPVGIAVTEAIQKSVESMIVEGVRDGLWQLNKPSDITNPVFVNYSREEIDNSNKDFLGRVVSEKRGPLSVNINGGEQIFSGDYPHSEWDRSAGLKLRYQTSSNFYLALCLGRGELSAMDAFKNDFDFADLRGEYCLLEGYNIKPYVDFGLGLIYREESGISPNYYPERSGTAFFSSLVWGAGIEYRLGNNIGLNFEVINHYALSDQLDGITNGKFNDFYWNGNFGINIYFTGE